MTLFARRLIVLAITMIALELGLRSGDAAETTEATLNDGYSIFYNFCDQESQLSLLFWFKSAPA